MQKIEVRSATPEDVAKIEGQIAECIAIHVAAMGGEFGQLDALEQMLDCRSKFLSEVRERALAGEPLTFVNDAISFHSPEAGVFGTSSLSA